MSKKSKLVSYNYTDAWGNFTVSYSNGGGSTGAQYNPFRYRSYYYDTDLGMYYLQSRYYDAKICRFISADGYVSTGQGILGNNMFAYCGNNPVNMLDPTGEIAITTLILIIVGVAIITTASAITYGAYTEDTIVLDLSYTTQKHLKYGNSLLIDFKGGNIELYQHSGVSTSTGLSFTVGKVFNYDGPGSYGGPFVSIDAGYYIGGEYCFNPLDTSGTSAASITFSTSPGVSFGVDYFTYYPLSYNYKKGRFNLIKRKDCKYEIPLFPIL
jgi:RHS repeat-associated protein